MESKNDIKNELLQISRVVADIPRVNVHSSPGVHYFDMLSNEIMTTLFKENTKENRTPEGYFQNLAGEVMNKIRNLEEADTELTDVLKNLKKINVYTVPNGYFDGLEISISNHIRQKTKTISLPRTFPVFKYAIAATVTALLGLGVYTLTNKTIIVEDNSLASLVATASNINKSNTFEKEMTNLKEEEIVNYLNEKGDDVNAALVASLSDEQSLPEEDEYLTDENRLDDYLNEFNLSN